MNNATDALTTHNTTIVTSNTTIITPEQPIGYGGVIHCPTKDGSVQKCTTGYCCANNSGCCINYMELWWFWLIWVRIYCTGVVVVWLVLVWWFVLECVLGSYHNIFLLLCLSSSPYSTQFSKSDNSTTTTNNLCSVL